MDKERILCVMRGAFPGYGDLGQQTIVGSRHTNWFEIGELEEVPSSLWLTQGGLGCSTLFLQAMQESFIEQLFMKRLMCCALGHSTLLGGRT